MTKNRQKKLFKYLNINKLKKTLHLMNIKSTILNTNVACHNSLLIKAEQELAEFINFIKFKSSDINFIPINKKFPLNNPDEVKENLKIHMTSRVNWEQNMYSMAKKYQDYTHIEIGASNILKGFYIQNKIDLTIKTTREVF